MFDTSIDAPYFFSIEIRLCGTPGLARVKHQNVSLFLRMDFLEQSHTIQSYHVALENKL
jgi:hypothetical protein